MAIRVDRLTALVSRDVPVKIGDTLSFVEDGDFLNEFRECDLTDDDLECIQTVITACPTGGEVVPVSRHIRDLFYRIDSDATVVIRYVYFEPCSTVLFLTAFWGDAIQSLTPDEAKEAEEYIAEQLEFFANRHTR